MSSSQIVIRIAWLVVVMAFLVPQGVVSGNDKEKKNDAEIIKGVAVSCARKCHDLCAALPKSEDPYCDRRCDSISTAFNGSTKEPAALDPNTAITAVQEVHMCSTGCSLWCMSMTPAAAIDCKDKCADSFRPFGPAIAVLGNTLAAKGLAPPSPQAATGLDMKFLEACSGACYRKCTAAGKKACDGSCVEACGLYSGAITVLQAAMPAAAVPSTAALAGETITSTFKACNKHCAANDNKCGTMCSYAGYVVSKAKASMMLATGGFAVPA